jgi:hypothetical protein
MSAFTLLPLLLLNELCDNRSKYVVDIRRCKIFVCFTPVWLHGNVAFYREIKEHLYVISFSLMYLLMPTFRYYDASA